MQSTSKAIVWLDCDASRHSCHPHKASPTLNNENKMEISLSYEFVQFALSKRLFRFYFHKFYW